MFNLLFMLIGMAVGLVLAPSIGGCDGSIWVFIKQTTGIEKVEDKQSFLDNFSIVTTAHAEESTSKLTPVKKLNEAIETQESTLVFETKSSNGNHVDPPWIPTIVEKHKSSLETTWADDNPGFGVIASCDMAEDDCFYIRTYSVVPLHYMLDNAHIIDDAVTSLSRVMHYESRCLQKTFGPEVGLSFTQDYRAFLLDPENRKTAIEWNNSVVDRLHLSRSSNIDSVIQWDILHDKLLTYHYDSEEQKLYKVRVGHPAGDVYMLYFQVKLLSEVFAATKNYMSDEATKEFCNYPG